MKINVTDKDINKGVTGSPYDCAVAKALKRIYHTNQVHVTTSAIEVLGKSYRTPKAVQEFIAVFDAGYTPYAMAFNLGQKKTKKQARLVEVKESALELVNA